MKLASKELEQLRFWALTAEEAARALETDLQNGLPEEEALSRLGVFGQNVIEKPQRAAGLAIVLNQFKSPLILILCFAGLLTLFIAHYRDAIFILAAVAVNTALGFYQEYKAEKALAELKTYLKERSRVIRGGGEREIDAENLVPGDLIRLSQGDRSSADGRIVFANDLQVNEAILTGESLPVLKSAEPAKTDAVLPDQQSMVFAGTLITQGVGTAIVCRTDFFTELGKIASLVKEARSEETPLQTAVRRFSMRAGILLGGLTMLIFGIGITLGHSRLEMFLISIAIAVSAVPEGLPIALTVILAMGVERMAKKNGVIRKLVAAEALGSTTVILTDKTGTLTMAKMELEKILPVQENEEKRLLELAILNTNVLVENPNDPSSEWRVSGRIMETALVRHAAGRGITVNETKNKLQILNFLPFNALNKFSIALIHERGKHFLVFFGAPDTLIAHSELNAEEKTEMLERINELAFSGKHVLGLAIKEVDEKQEFDFSKDLKLSRLSFKGLFTFTDPVRAGAKETIRRVERAGIRTVIVTGDHRGTAETVAKEVGMQIGKEAVLDAAELSRMSDADLKKLLPRVRVISRVSPADKVRILKAFQEAGEVVAMTGDGVNDAPSIKQADIGIAMGSGTEVARDVADLVLLDNNLATIAAAVEEGRRILNNIRKVIVYLFSNVADGLFLIGGALLLGIALPLNALQILWVNFFSDSFPAIAFAFEKDIDGLGTRPQTTKSGLFDPLMKFLVLFIGISTSALLFALYWLLLRAGFQEDLVKTFVFASFGSYTLFLAFSVRSLEKSIFAYQPLSNPYLVGGVAVGIALMLSAIYLAPLQSLLGTVALPAEWLLGVLLIGALNIAAVEFGKRLFRPKAL